MTVLWYGCFNNLLPNRFRPIYREFFLLPLCKLALNSLIPLLVDHLIYETVVNLAPLLSRSSLGLLFKRMVDKRVENYDIQVRVCARVCVCVCVCVCVYVRGWVCVCVWSITTTDTTGRQTS
jgi:hypothetical protein